MKTAITLLLSLVAFAGAFTNVPAVGKAVPRLAEQSNVAAFQPQQANLAQREKDTALANALRYYSNYGDVWDGGYGYGGMGGGMYGPYSGGYRRGGYG